MPNLAIILADIARDLQHLESFFELDLLVHFSGRERSDINDDDYPHYYAFCLKATLPGD